MYKQFCASVFSAKFVPSRTSVSLTYTTGYGTPILIVASLVIKSFVDKENHYVRFNINENVSLCWLDTDSIGWFFLFPVSVVLISYVLIVGMVLKVASTKSIQAR